MDKLTITYREIMENIINIDMVGNDETGEGIFDVLTSDGYIYTDITEASIRDLRPELIY